MRRRKQTYADIAAQLDVTMCSENDLCRQSLIDHEHGDYAVNRIHWRDRRVTKSGLYRFLKLVSQARNRLVSSPWARTYLVNKLVQTYARQLHTRIPFEVTLEDRLRVKTAVMAVPRGAPFRKEAFQWSRRRS